MIERAFPETNFTLAGYAALIERYQLRVPLPKRLSGISEKHKKYETPDWLVFTPRHQQEGSLLGQLTFALKNEGVDLAILNALFKKVDCESIQAIVEAEPSGAYSRRIWFLYEWLTEKKLELADASQGNFVPLLDEKLQYPGPVRPSKRHRIQNNLPGVRNFCPLIRRTDILDSCLEMRLSEHTQTLIGQIHPDILLRAAAFLLLSDSKASYAIEGESPPHNRAERWGRIIGQAGQAPLSVAELERLQKEVITDARFLSLGLRQEGGFIGLHERSSGLPIPDHISAKWQDLPALVQGLIETDQLLKDSNYPAVLAAALIAFGFVFIHPFEDGNGRIHRYLLHHVLAEKKFTPPGVIFPVSAVILERIAEYKRVLESYSNPRLAFIEWKATSKGNVEVLNDTLDLYRYFDATAQAMFLYDCVYETATKTLPNEIAYLEKYGAIKSYLKEILEMPDRMVDLLIRFLDQGKGTLSKRALENEFKLLTKAEIVAIETHYQQLFNPKSF